MAQTIVTTPTQKELQSLQSSPQAQTRPKSTIVMDKTLASSANLANLLPTGTFLAFQSLSPSFTNKGKCYASNTYLTIALILLCSLSCLFFSLTDSLRGSDGKTYYGIATFKGMYVLNYEGGNDVGDEEKGKVLKDLRKYRIRILDYVHGFFSMLVLLSLTFGSSDVRSCLFPNADANVKQLLANLPLGAGVLSSLVFMTFPTTRRGIGYIDSSHHAG